MTRLHGTRVLVATLFGLGRFPFASGTLASATTLPAAIVLAMLGQGWFIAGTFAAIAVAFWSAGAGEREFGQKDPHAVVIDEVAGQMVALTFLPLSAAWYAGGFLLFRVFDVLKPFPARLLERVPGGPGIVLDDLAAGLYANLILQAVQFFWLRGASF